MGARLEQIRCKCGKRLGDLAAISGNVVLQLQCRDRDCRRLVEVTIDDKQITVREIGAKPVHTQTVPERNQGLRHRHLA